MNKEGYELMGQNVNGYTIIKPIGQGKFSIVYRAEKDGQPYAVKKIKIFDMADQKQRQKCLKQVELMKPLDHPNIIKYIDSFIHNNQLIIVTEWAQKGDLKKLIKQHEGDQLPFEEHVIWQYMRQVSSALSHMHEKRIMHRDLKPANIFISHDSTLKIGDLGLGRIFGSQTFEAYSKVGTPLYMSPQLIKDAGYNMNADVWSLGCICYELCELNSPFRNRQQKMSLMDLFEIITKYNYKPISSRYSPELSKVIREMIIVDPNRRLNADQVLEIATKNTANVKKSKLDPYIAMEDIHIKLNLLNYDIMFCKAAQRKPIHKYYFAQQDKKCAEQDQLFYFLELVYWIMGLAKPNKHKDKLPVYTKSSIDWKSPDNACRKLFADLNGVGINFDDIDVQSVRNVHDFIIKGRALEKACAFYSIKSNFQFGEPKQMVLTNQGNSYVSAQGENEDIQQDKQDKISEESLEEQSQFQQSIFFKKNRNKIADDMKLLQKINEFDQDQDRAIIVSKVDQKEWKSQCLRLEKQLGDINNFAKDAKKKHTNFNNFETSKVCSAKLTDLVRYVKPAASIMFKKIDQDLQKISIGQRGINQLFKDMKANYTEQSAVYKELSLRSVNLTSFMRQRTSELQKLQQKIGQLNEKMNQSTKQSENNRGSDLRQAMSNLKKEIKEMQQKQGIISMELQKRIRKSGKEDFMQVNYLDEEF